MIASRSLCVFYILAFASFVTSFLHTVLDEPIVNTNNGRVRGIITSQNREKVFRFLKIPFAEPPVGDLRFRKTVPKGNWSGILDASSKGPACPQYSSSKLLMSEDCLYLNIYIPREINPHKKKSVMVYIHGGAYTHGTGNRYDGSSLAITGDVILVFANYRLGILGFLSSEDDRSIGNYGIWDQIEAIKWVKQNIASFGGDSDRITIFGESSGGYSVGLLSLLPATKGIFNRVIAESGVALSPRALSREASKTFDIVAKSLNCATDNKTIMECLRNRQVDEYTTVSSRLVSDDIQTPSFIMRFGPVIDGDLIPKEPYSLLSNSTSDAYAIFMSRDFMAGTNNGDGGLLLKYFPPNSSSFNISIGIPLNLFCQRIVRSISRDYFHSNITLTDAMCLKYKALNYTLQEQALKAVDFYGDFGYAAPTVQSLNIHSMSTKQSFHYIYSHIPEHSTASLPPWFNRANHATDVQFEMGIQHKYPDVSKEEIALSNLMMTYWTNFAKYGNPNGLNFTSRTQVLWPSYKINNSYLNIDVNPSVGTNLYKDRMDFWMSILNM